MTNRSHRMLRLRPFHLIVAAFISFVLPATVSAGQGTPLIHLARAQGDEPTKLVQFGEFDCHGSPDWSADGSKIAFDAWRTARGENHVAAHLIVAASNGSEPRDLGTGAMPSWSPDGRRLTFSHYDPRGVFVMNADGTDRKLLAEDGWCGRWSPDGKTIAYTVYRSGKADLCLHDLESGQNRFVFADAGSPYRSIFWSYCWSPDSKRLCFRGVASGTDSEVATVSVDGPATHFHVHYRGESDDAFSWHPDGDRILMAMHSPVHGGRRLFTFAADGSTEPTPLLGLPEDLGATAGDWSPDGSKLVFPAFPVSVDP